MVQKAARLDPEKVAYWYFRLNGFFQMESFIVHPEGKGGQRTDADLLGIRFPHRKEMFFDCPDHPMADDTENLALDAELIDVVIIEVKTNQPCTLNGPWSDQKKENLQRLLAAVGCFPMDQVQEVAQTIYSYGEFRAKDVSIRVRLIALGHETNEELTKRYPAVVQITWESVLTFIGQRLHTFRINKRDVPQWDDQIRTLKDLVKENSKDGEFCQAGFLAAAKANMGLNAVK